VLNTEMVFEPDLEFRTGVLVSARFEFLEFFGPSSLPPAATRAPSGFTTLNGLPVSDIEPTYGSSVTGGYRREGELHDMGISRHAEPLGDRARATADGEYLLLREEWWRALRFFDSRRGRLLPFFTVDRSELFRVVSIDASGLFVNVARDGDLEDFEDELDYLGIVTKDGTAYAREVVSVQDVFGVWRVSLATALPAIDAADIRRCARG